MPAIPINNDLHWHLLRAHHVGGSEIGALFDASPWMTRFTLWHEKAGKARIAREVNDRMRLGTFLEEYIAAELGGKLGWRLLKSKVYHQHPTVAGMGCTLDFDIIDHEWGPGLCETKLVFDYMDYQQNWTRDRAPVNYELQVQHQFACTGYSWGVIACLVMQTGTIMPAIVRRPEPKVIGLIEGKVAAFWESIRENVPPPPTGTEDDLAVLRDLYPARAPRKVAESADADLNTEASLLRWAQAEAAGMKRQITSAKARLLAVAGDAEILRVPGFNVYIKQSSKGAVTMKVQEAAGNEASAEIPANILVAG